jgi:hypothetical protein
MGIRRLLTASEDEDGTDEGSEGTTYWCTVCGMLFERSSPRIDYSWCTRCGAEGVRELPWKATS